MLTFPQDDFVGSWLLAKKIETKSFIKNHVPHPMENILEVEFSNFKTSPIKILLQYKLKYLWPLFGLKLINRWEISGESYSLFFSGKFKCPFFSTKIKVDKTIILKICSVNMCLYFNRIN